MEESPLHQFTINQLLDIRVAHVDLSFTNSSLWIAISVAAAYVLVMFGTRQHAMVPGRLQSVVEMTYEFVANMLEESTGKAGMRFFPLVFSLFIFLLMGNTLGLIPGGFTFTSHIIVTFTMAICVFVAVTILGIILHGWHFLSFFVPQGAPWYILPILVPIEILSYCMRPVSLSIRLFCNMMAGHTMVAIFAGFVVALSGFFVIPAVAPFALIVALMGFEFAVAFLQAYVFTVLTCIYLNDAIHLH